MKKSKINILLTLIKVKSSGIVSVILSGVERLGGRYTSTLFSVTFASSVIPDEFVLQNINERRRRSGIPLLLSILLLLAFSLSVSAQEERKNVRQGNSAYESGDFKEAEVQYLKALEKNSKLYEGTFNLGDALYKQERYEEAENQFQIAASKTTDKDLQAKAYHNLGNTYMKQDKLKEGIEAYKNALRANPKDIDTKYNLSKAMRMLQQQQKQDQENKDDKQDDKKEDKKDEKKDGDKNDENKDKQDDEKKDGDKDGEQDKKDQDKEGDQDKKGDEGDEPKDKQPKPQQAKMTKEQAKRMLDALKNEEQKVQEKMALKKMKGQRVKVEKDW